MLLVADVNVAKRLPINGETSGVVGIDRLKVIRSDIPAVTHVDHSARIQTVDHDTVDFTDCSSAFTRRPAAPCLSTPASTFAASQSLLARTRLSMFPRDEHGRSGD